jgi:hypothetical protein
MPASSDGSAGLTATGWAARLVAQDRAANARRRLLATLGAVVIAAFTGGCASMSPDGCGAKAKASAPPPVSVRCSVRF